MLGRRRIGLPLAVLTERELPPSVEALPTADVPTIEEVLADSNTCARLHAARTPLTATPRRRRPVLAGGSAEARAAHDACKTAPVQMTFDSENERGYYACRDQLSTRFAEWVEQRSTGADASDVELLLNWKWGYADGRLDHWSVADVEEFLLVWCPRKLAAPPDLLVPVPRSVAAYVDFLAHEGLLAPDCSPVEIRRACAELEPRFRAAMADPTNFGMAKSLFGGLGEADPTAVLEQLAQLTGTSTDEVLGLLADQEPTVIGPVRAPTDDEVAAAIAEARTFAHVRGLAAQCDAPGLTLTAKGNLRLADARRLTVELATGDEPNSPIRKLTSAAELPQLSRLVRTAIAAGAVRRLRGRLVAVARFADRSDRDAYERIVRAALEVRIGGPMAAAWMAGPSDAAVVLLAELIDAGEVGASPDDIAEHVGPLLGGSGPLAEFLAAGEIEYQLARLADLGLVTTIDGLITLTAAGRWLGAQLVSETGVEVVFRADPAIADAGALVASMLLLDEDAARADLTAWADANPAGAGDFVVAALQPDHGPADVLGLLEQAGAVFGPDADVAAMTHRAGPRAPLVTMWLLLRGAIEPSTVDPELMLVGTVEVAAAMLDEGGPEGVVEFFGADVDETTDVLRQLWRAEHERTVEVLDVLGHHHPDKAIAKAARRSLMQARSRG